MIRLLFSWALVTAIVALGCNPGLRVIKNPGNHANGIRYYRPKPYLFISPTAEQVTTTAASNVSVAVTGASPDLVTIELQYLPDFTEEYALNVRTGLGTNKTTIKLEEGWKLTEINQELDSKFAENLKAVGDLIKSVAPSGLLAAPTGRSATAELVGDGKQLRAKMYVRNVPFGYYEPVVREGYRKEGKRLYGWKYVGFAPFANCPIAPCGEEPATCDNGSLDLYGLVMDHGVMVFRKLNDIAKTDVSEVLPYPKPGVQPSVLLKSTVPPIPSPTPLPTPNLPTPLPAPIPITPQPGQIAPPSR